ncbi:MAG: DUF4266 domain-containing protein [Natronospirillum sp.]
MKANNALKTGRLLLPMLWLIFTAGCASVAPWERGALAQPGMAVDGHPIDSYVDDHVYFSKEAATGGSGVGGGGCGCN